MLNKLMRYEFRAFGSRLFPLMPLMLAAALVSALLREAAIWAQDSSVMFVFTIFTSLSSLFALASIVVPVVAAAAILCTRYAKNMAGNQAYLTFSLPVTINTHLWLRVLSAAVYLAAAFVTSFISLRILLLFPSRDYSWQRIADALSLSGRSAESIAMEALIWFMAFFFVFTLVLMVYTAASISTQFSKNKVIAGVVAYILLYNTVGVIYGIFFGTIAFATGGAMPLTGLAASLMGYSMSAYNPPIIFVFGMLAELAFWYFGFMLAVYYFTSRVLFTRRMSLE